MEITIKLSNGMAQHEINHMIDSNTTLKELNEIRDISAKFVNEFISASVAAMAQDALCVSLDNARKDTVDSEKFSRKYRKFCKWVSDYHGEFTTADVEILVGDSILAKHILMKALNECIVKRYPCLDSEPMYYKA